jgi:hypothetical protein
MQKDQAYHESAIVYNEGLAEFAENLVPLIEHDEVKRWCTAVGKQHRFHAKRHRLALNKFLLKQAAPSVEAVMDGLDVPPQSEPTVVSGEAVLQSTLGIATDVEDILEPEVEVLADGCSLFHDPSRMGCQYYPKPEEQ